MTCPDSTFSHDAHDYWNGTAAQLLSAEMWGLACERRSPLAASTPHPPHVTTELLGTPEGLLLIARCTACGGRHEGLLDFRELSSVEQCDVSRAMDAIEANAHTAVARWSEAHANCMGTPMVHHVPAEVEGVLREEVAVAVADIRAGEPLSSKLVMLMSDRSFASLPLAELPHGPVSDSVRSSTIASHAVHATAREHARRTGVRPLAVVLVGDVCLPLMNGGAGAPDDGDELDQEELLTVLVATPEAMVLAVAPITRELGLSGVGPGEVGPLTFDLVKVACPMVDGLFATSYQS